MKQITIKADPQNPNRMEDSDKERMALSLAEFGDLGGIVINKRTGLLIGGHQRVSVLGDSLEIEDLKKPEPDGTVGRGWITKDGRRYAVRVVDWDEAKAHAALLAANRFGRVGKDDTALLKDMLEELDTGAVNMDLTGFDHAAIENLMTQFHVEPFGDTSTERDGQGVGSTWESCKKTGAAPVRIGPMETHLTVETAQRICHECIRRFETKGTPINETLEELMLCALQS